MGNVINLSGQRFGMLVVIKESGRNKSGSAKWLCKCDCGNETTTASTYLRTGDTKSCGCLHEGKLSLGNIKHGMHGSQLYNSWYGMKRRCVDKNHIRYERYGGRGITVCKDWMTFEGFCEDMKESYKVGLTIDRKDNNKGYSKDNCRWMGKVGQANNKSSNRVLEYEGKLYTMAELSRAFNINYGTLKSRLNNGLTVRESINKPIENKGRR